MKCLALSLALVLAFAAPAQAQLTGPVQPPAITPCSAFGTTAGTCAQGGVITGGGPTGGATTVPVITYNAAGQLTAVTTAATGVTVNGTAAVGQLPGTATNDAATAGNVGELKNTILKIGSEVSFTTGTAKTVTSVSLTAGDWDATGVLCFDGAAATNVTFLIASIGPATDALATLGTTARVDLGYAASTIFASGINNCVLVGPTRVSLSATTTMYLVGDGAFTVSTLKGYGEIRARRVR